MDSDGLRWTRMDSECLRAAGHDGPVRRVPDKPARARDSPHPHRADGAVSESRPQRGQEGGGGAARGWYPVIAGPEKPRGCPPLAARSPAASQPERTREPDSDNGPGVWAGAPGRGRAEAAGPDRLRGGGWHGGAVCGLPRRGSGRYYGAARHCSILC